MKYRKKPVIIEAYQVTKDLLEPILFDRKEYPKGLGLSSAETFPPKRTINCWFGSVVTIHGQKTRVDIDDWVVSEPDGEHFYPCKPDIFEATYELVEEQP